MGRASNSLHCSEGHEVFYVVTGGRPSSFSRRISGGNRSSELVEENAEGVRIPRGYVVEKTRPGALEQKKRPHDIPTAFSVASNANSMLCSVTHAKTHISRKIVSDGLEECS